MKNWCAALTAAASMLLPSGAPAANSPPSRVDVVLDAGMAAYGKHDYVRAASLWKSVLPSLIETHDERVGYLLFDMGQAYTKLADYRDAYAAFAQAGLAHGARKDWASLAADSLNAGVALRHLGRYHEALTLLRWDADTEHRLGNQRDEAAARDNLGSVEESLGMRSDALTSYHAALAVSHAIGDQSEEGPEAEEVGRLERDSGNYDAALAAFAQAIAANHTLGNRTGEAFDLNASGIVAERNGDDPAALSFYQRALMVAKAAGDRVNEAAALGGTGNAYTELGRYDEALAAQQQALAIHRAIGDRSGQADNLENIGIITYDVGSYEQALTLYRQALDLYRAVKNADGVGTDSMDVGNVQLALGSIDSAAVAYAAALKLFRSLKESRKEGAVLGNLALLDEMAGRPERALDELRQALVIDRASANVVVTGDVVVDIALVEDELGRHEEAIKAARDAIALFTRIANTDLLWRAEGLAGRAEAHLGHRDDALAYYDAELKGIESIRASLNETERGAFFTNKLTVYDEYIAYLRDLDAQLPGRGYDLKALEVLERKSARATLEQIGQSAAQHFKGVPAEIVARENAASAAVDGAQGLLAKVRARATTDAAAEAAAERDVADARSREVTLESSVRAQYPVYYQLRHPQPVLVTCAESPCVTIAGFQQSVLQPGELVLVYDLLKVHSVLWLIDRDSVHLVSLTGSESIDAAVERLGTHVAGMLRQLQPGARAETKLENAAAADLPGFTADSYALDRMLLPDAAAAIVARAKSVIVVPSGSLYRLAFETLVTRDPANAAQPHYLLEDVPVSYIPSASLLGVVRSSYAQPTAGRSPLLAFANPTFGNAPPGDGRGVLTYADLQLAAARSIARSSEPAAAVSDAVFPELPGTQTEADAVRAALAAPGESIIAGDRATRERVLDLNKSDQLKAYQYLLFATHAVLPSEIKGLTQPAIVLAHPERGDGLLTMADVFGLSLDADFVTLSACNTGVPAAESSGEGISGLTRAFLYAGTPAISVTLWEVDDAAAPQITPPFFAGMHSVKLTAAESLRQAKLAMLRSPQARFRHPYAWGPGVIFGDGDRLR